MPSSVRIALSCMVRIFQAGFQAKVVWAGRPAGPVYGVNGQSQESKIAYIPNGIGGVNGVLQAQAAPGEIALLFVVSPLSEGACSI